MSRLPGAPIRRRAQAQGFMRCGLMRINVQFDPDTFAQVSARAAKDGCSFAEKVRQLVEWGLEA